MEWGAGAESPLVRYGVEAESSGAGGMTVMARRTNWDGFMN